jgi:hypothetical protein
MRVINEDGDEDEDEGGGDGEGDEYGNDDDEFGINDDQRFLRALPDLKPEFRIPLLSGCILIWILYEYKSF